MDGGEVGHPSEKNKLSLSDELDYLCKYYMMMGVSYEDFWYGDYCKLKFIEENYYNTMQRRNSEMWLQGIYVYYAFSSVLAAAFSKRSTVKYPSEPIDLGFMEDTRTAEAKQAEAIRKVQAQLEQQKLAWKAKHKEKQ